MINDMVATVPCGICGTETRMTGTKRCDYCWELERRIERHPERAQKVLDELRGGPRRVQFNLNSYVWVKVTLKGHQMHRAQHERLKAHAIERGASPVAWTYRPLQKDANGWTKLQGWEVMKLFGSEMYNGSTVPIETTIELELPSAK